MNKSVYSHFISLSGESSSSGIRTLFIRLRGCNLRCSYCDTCYAQEITQDPQYIVNIQKLIKDVLSDNPGKIPNVILTGGEPLLQLNSSELSTLDLLVYNLGATLQIETNGSIHLPINSANLKDTSYVMDYKLPSSGVENSMQLSNFNMLSTYDEIKFIIKDAVDFSKMLDIINTYKLSTRVKWIWVSPCYGAVDMEWLWAQVSTAAIPNMRLQLQIHKVFVPNANSIHEV